jgi:hypothetical protein
MSCPACGAANPIGAKFCVECGTRFAAGCRKERIRARLLSRAARPQEFDDVSNVTDNLVRGVFHIRNVSQKNRTTFGNAHNQIIQLFRTSH